MAAPGHRACSELTGSLFSSTRRPQNPGKSRSQGRAWKKHSSKRLQFLSLCVAANPCVALTKEKFCKRPVGFDERHWLDVTQFAQSSARDLVPVTLGVAASLISRVTQCDGLKGSFQRVSPTQASGHKKTERIYLRCRSS